MEQFLAELVDLMKRHDAVIFPRIGAGGKPLISVMKDGVWTDYTVVNPDGAYTWP
jgi:hypothetical protein